MLSRLPPGEVQLFFKERFNIAPTQDAPVVYFHDGQIIPGAMRWGIFPPWSSYPIINIKSETLAGRGAFHDSFLNRRCMVPADGFYEWRKPGKTPFRFVLPDQSAFCFAGVWEASLIKGAAQPRDTFAIITTAASPEVRPIHDRMPLILRPQDYDSWLGNTGQAAEILKAKCEARLDAYPINSIVNKATNEDPRCIQPPEKTLL